MNENAARRTVHGPVTLIVLGLVFAAGVGNLSLLAEIRGQSAAMTLTARGRTYCYQLLYLTDEFLLERVGGRKDLDPAGARTAEVHTTSVHPESVHPESVHPEGVGPEMRTVIAKMDDRFLRLRAGDHVLGLPSASNERFLEGLAECEKVWRESIKPRLETLLAMKDPGEQRRLVDGMEPELRAFAIRIEEGTLLYQEAVEGRIETLHLIQYGMVAMVLILGVANLLGSGWFRNPSIGR